MSTKEEEKNNDVVNKPATLAADVAIGAKSGTCGYRLDINSMADAAKACKVKIMTNPNVSKGQCVMRFDAPHYHLKNPACRVPHININPKVNTRLTADPHFPIPNGQSGLKAIHKGAEIFKKANKVLVPVAIAINVVQEAVAVTNDVKNGTSRNTVETTAAIAGGWCGGYGGASGGAAIGTLFFPGVGTLVGGIIGGLSGSIFGSIAAQKAVGAIGDACEYDIETACKPCRKCGRKFKYRKYLRNGDDLCDDCHQIKS